MTLSINRRQALLAGLGGLLIPKFSFSSSNTKVYFGYATSKWSIDVFTCVLSLLQEEYKPNLPKDVSIIPGENGMRAIQKMAKEQDSTGGTVLIGLSSSMTLYPSVKKLPFDLFKTIKPVAPIFELTFAFCVGKNVPEHIKTLSQYISWVKQNPQYNRYGVIGMGSSTHFVGMQFAQVSQTVLKPEAYPGVAPLKKEIMEGNLSAGFLVVHAIMDEVKNGSIRCLAVCSQNRWLGLEDTPTFHEIYPEIIPTLESMGLYVPYEVPTSKVSELGLAVQNAVIHPTFTSLLSNNNLKPSKSTPEEYKALLDYDLSQWQILVKKFNFSLAS